MKILLTGGGTGGHFYPLIAIAEELNRLHDEQRFVNFKIYYMSDKPYDKDLLEEQFITFIPITAGKMRVYFSWQNFVDVFKTMFGTIGALFKVFSLYPDVVISKGGYASFPVLVAAKLLRIPVIIHESDTVPGRVSRWSGKFARKVALSFPEASAYFDERKVSVTGHPIRKNLTHVVSTGANEYFDLSPGIKTVGVWGGSQGSRVINDSIISILKETLEKYQIIHQTGANDFKDVTTEARIIMGENTDRSRYKVYPFLNNVQTKMFGGAVDLVISRSGSSLFEIAAWGKPSILIPYRHAHGDHQRKNAYHYARTGACTVIEEENLTPSILLNQIENILNNKERYTAMSEHAKSFYKPDAARIIATEAVSIAIAHEKI